MTDAKSNYAFSFETGEFRRLIEAAREGSTDALQTVSEGCRDYLLLIANQELDVDLRAKMGPSDIVQNSLIAVNEHIDDFRGENLPQFLAWAKAILVNDLRRARRDFKQVSKRDVQREKPLAGNSEIGLPTIEPNSREATPGTRAVANEEARLLQVALSKLTEEQRQVIQWRNWDRLSFEEIGQQMNRSADAAQKLWSRAILRLKAELKLLQVL